MLKGYKVFVLSLVIIFIVSTMASPSVSFAEGALFEYVGQDSLFYINDTPATQIGVDCQGASDGKAAQKSLVAVNTWDFQLRMTNGIFTNDPYGNVSGTSPLVLGTAYELYARVKVVFNDENAAGNAFTMGVYSISNNNYPVPEGVVPLSGLNSNEWTDIKVGTYFPSLTGRECIFLSCANYMQDVISDVYVDKFYFKEAPVGVPVINAGRKLEGSPVPYQGGLVKIPVTTVNIADGRQLAVKVLDSIGTEQSFPVSGNTIQGGSTMISISVPKFSAGGIYTAKISCEGAETQDVAFRVQGDYVVEDSAFTYSHDASRVSDSGAADNSAGRMNGTVSFRDIQYKVWDFSTLKHATTYDIYFRIKANTSANAAGNAVKIGLYDTTQGMDLITPRVINTTEVADKQWHEFRLGSVKPDYGVNNLEFYMEGAGNAGIPDIYLDNIVFREVIPYTVQNDKFNLIANSSNVPDGLTPDNCATRVMNGSNTQIPVLEIPIDADKLISGDYNLVLLVNPDRPQGADWNQTTGDVLGISLHDVTDGRVLLPKKVYNTSGAPFEVKLEYFSPIKIPVTIDPTHDYKICFYSVANTGNFPSFRVDSATLYRVLPEDYYDSGNKYDNVYPYKISPSNRDGINDYTTIFYSIYGSYIPGKTIDVTVYSVDGNEVKKIVNDREDWTYVKETWNGTDNSGNIVPNGLYTIEVKRSDNTVFLRKNVQVISGVTLTTATVNPAKQYFPKGVWFEAGNIPFNAADARAYLDRCFRDIKEAGCDTVYMANWHAKPDIYGPTLEKAAEYGINVIGLPDSSSLFKFWDGNFWSSEGLYSNDETEMYNKLQELANEALTQENANKLIGFLLFDEPRSMYITDKEKFRYNLTVMRRMLESISPNRFTVIDYCMPEDAEYFYSSNKTQALSMDIYPASSSYTGIGNFKHIGGYPNAAYEESLDVSTLQVRESLTNDAPLWPIIQTHETEPTFRNPLPSEVRAMTYEAIGRGAKGATYFMYQSTVGWKGMVDYDYTRRPEDYDTVKQLLGEIDVLKPTILDMQRIANVATTSGGGGGANVNPPDEGYLNADVTTHKSVSSGDKYLVVVNHNCETSAQVSITIDRAKLGMNITAIKEISKVDGSESAVSFTTTADSYIISGMTFAAGDGKILRLVRDAAQNVKEVQDSQFGTWGAESTRSNADISASDGKTAIKIGDDSNSAMDFYCYLSDPGLTAGKNYDVYALVKIKYKTDMNADVVNGPSFPKPAGNAFTVGASWSAGGIIIWPMDKSAGNIENMLWTSVKIGEFTATTNNLAANAAYVFLNPANNMANVEAVYVDKFYFVEK